MKKINILTIVIVLLALATPLMADVTVSGVVKYGVILGPNTFQADELTSTEKQEAKITVTATPDDNNTASITILAHNLNDPTQDGLDEAKYVSNLLGAMGLGDIPVTVTLTGGYWESNNANVGVFSKYEFEDVFNMDTKTWQFGIDVGILDMVTVRVDLDPTWAYQPAGPVGNADTNNIGYLIGAFGGAGPVMAEFFYTNRSAPFDQTGLLGIGVGVSLEFGDIGINVGVNVAMDLQDAPLTTADLGIGIGFSMGTLISASVCTTGYIAEVGDNSIIDKLAFHASVTPIDIITISAGMVLGLDDVVYADPLRQFDINISTSAGALGLNVGFLFTPDSAFDVEDTFSWTKNNEEGGVYIGAVLEF